MTPFDGRRAGLAIVALAALGSLFLASRFLLPPTGAFALAAPPAACVDLASAGSPELTRTCVTYETLALHAPLVLALLVAGLGLLRRRSALALAGAGLAAAAWIPWGAFHAATRGWAHAGARVSIAQTALLFLALAALLALAARAHEPARPASARS